MGFGPHDLLHGKQGGIALEYQGFRLASAECKCPPAGSASVPNTPITLDYRLIGRTLGARSDCLDQSRETAI